MASDNFAATNSPLASPWTGFGGSFGGLRSVSGGCRNVAGSDGDAGAYYSSSSATSSQIDYISGTTDGGPALHMGTGPDGYVITAYDGAIVYAFRLDDGSYSSELGHATGVYVTTLPVKIRRSGSNLITSLNGVDTLTVTNNTYTGGSPGIFAYAGNLIFDNWTDGATTNYTLALAQGSYTLSGQAVGLKTARKLALAQGSYALTGQATGMQMNAPITIAQGSYALNGQAVALRADRRLALAQGSYALTGQAQALKVARKTALAQGAYTLSGQTVTLTYSGATVTNYTLAMGQGSYNLVGSDAAVDVVMNVGSGSYSLSGQAVGLKYGHKVAAAQGSYALTGQALTIRVTRTMPAAQGSYALTGQDVGLNQHAPAPKLTVAMGSYGLFGNQVNLMYSGMRGEIFHSIPLNWWTKGL